MKTVPLKASRRTKLGKQPSKQARRKKQIPAIVYGSGIKATPVEVQREAFERVISTKVGENVIINLKVADKPAFEKTVVIKEIQHHPVTDAIDHVDFNAISLKEKIKVKVPLHIVGESAGVKEGGVLDVIQHEMEVECLPTDIPGRLDADISALKIGDSLRTHELAFPEGVVPMLTEDEIVVAVHAPKIEEEPVPEEMPTEPELIGKKEKEEGEEVAPTEEPGKGTGKKEKPSGGQKGKPAE